MQRMMFSVCFIFGGILIWLTAASAGGGAHGKTVAKTDLIEIHASASGKSRVVGQLRKGEPVSIELRAEGSEGEWCAVATEGRKAVSGYVLCRQLEQKAMPERHWKKVDSQPARRASEPAAGGAVLNGGK